MMKPIKHKAAPKTPALLRPTPAPKESVPTPSKTAGMTIQGRQVDSTNEYNLGKALEQLKIPFRYQMPMGVQGVAGAQILDFYLPNESPRPAIIEVQGAHWHEDRTKELVKLAVKAKYFNNNVDVYYFSEPDTATIDAALNAYRNKQKDLQV